MDAVSRFEVGREMGARLRRIRTDAGLTMRELAVRMDRTNRSYGSRLSRLELGVLPGATFGLVMDYLRACRGSIHDVADILDRYTRRPVVPEERVRVEMNAERGHDLRLGTRSDCGGTGIGHVPRGA